MRYLPDASAEYDRQEKARERQREEQLRLKRQRDEEIAQAERKADARLLWDALPESERERRLLAMRQKNPRLQGHDSILVNFCLTELIEEQRQVRGE